MIPKETGYYWLWLTPESKGQAVYVIRGENVCYAGLTERSVLDTFDGEYPRARWSEKLIPPHPNSSMPGNSVNAWWTGESYHAMVILSPGVCENWWSDDGDHWNDSNGKSVQSEAFAVSKITLRGGPRDNNIMA